MVKATVVETTKPKPNSGELVKWKDIVGIVTHVNRSNFISIISLSKGVGTFYQEVPCNEVSLFKGKLTLEQ